MQPSDSPTISMVLDCTALMASPFFRLKKEGIPQSSMIILEVIGTIMSLQLLLGDGILMHSPSVAEGQVC